MLFLHGLCIHTKCKLVEDLTVSCIQLTALQNFLRVISFKSEAVLFQNAGDNY